jgi:hypothetical protein
VRLIALAVTISSLVTVGIVFSSGSPDGVFSGSPLVVSSNGSSNLKILNGSIYEVVDTNRIEKIGDLIKSKSDNSKYLVSTAKGKVIASVKFYRFHAVFFDAGDKFSGWAKRLSQGKVN